MSSVCGLRVNKINYTCHTRTFLEMCWWAGRQWGWIPHLLLTGILAWLPMGEGSHHQSGSVGECLQMGQFTSQDNPESDHQNIGTAPSDFLSHFCHLEENSVPSYLFKECSRPYLIAITSSSHNILATSLAGSALHKLIKVLIGMFCS